jgi:hypothetical protein
MVRQFDDYPRVPSLGLLQRRCQAQGSKISLIGKRRFSSWKAGGKGEAVRR